MTNQNIKMPDPVAKVHVGNPVRYEHIDAWCLDVGTHYLITTDQAEAYANAMVKQALEALEEAGDKILKLKTKEN